MVDYDDDWMNPVRSVSFESKTPENKTEYRILRKKATPVSGNVSVIYRWEVWSRHDTEGERDAALDNIKYEHPMWQVKAAEGNPYLESIGVFPND